MKCADCGMDRGVLPHDCYLDARKAVDSLRTDVASLTAERDTAVKQLARASKALSCIVLNATIIPDPSMHGATDCYSVPLDDVDDAKAFLAEGDKP